MKVLKINPDNPGEGVIKKVVGIIKKGGAMVYPTDTVYGLGVNALNEKAIKKLFKIKQRAAQKPISVLVRDVEMAKKAASFGCEIEKILRKILPGPITVILFKKRILPDILTGGSKKIGLRIPDYKFTRTLMENLDFPITTTSANISGQPASGNIGGVLKQCATPGVAHQPDLVLDAGVLPESRPSTVLDLTGPEPKILRAGPVNKNELKKIFNSL